MHLGYWPINAGGRIPFGRLWTVTSNWKGHPRYLFVGFWFAYTRGLCDEADGCDPTADIRKWRIGRKEFELIRPLKSWWAKYWFNRIYVIGL